MGNSFSDRMRRKRFKLFTDLIKTIESKSPVRILDIGGTVRFWERMGVTSENKFEITLLNLKTFETPHPFIKSMGGDCRDMSVFKDKEFEIVFSNSLIEHLSKYPEQERLSKEIQRVGHAYFVQTPNFYFPVEPHFLFPFFQFFPLAIKSFILKYLKLWQDPAMDTMKPREIAESIRLLKRSELRRLFPGGKIYKEKFLGLTKSFIVYSGFNGG